MDTTAQLNAALSGRYEIVREAGAGGMATVFLARDVRHDRQVAIKVLKTDLAASLGPDRFLREISIAAQLQHPHILPVFDSGDADGLLWYAMPFVAGESLRDRLKRDGPLPINDALTLTREIAGALGVAHAAGVVHRDIKPENILLSGGHALVADFGVAKALKDASTPRGGLTTAGMSLGTPGYMAPEQVAADPAANHRTDIYALGIVAWEMLVGKAPFADLPPAQQLAAQVTTVPDTVAAHRPDCPPSFAEAIARCLAKDPKERPQTADELKALLEGASGAHASRAFAGLKIANRRSPWPAVAVAAAVIIAAAAYYMKGGVGGSDPAEGPTLAVLPFENIQGDSSTAYFSDGITEEIIGTVSRLPGLHVASRSVSFRHRGPDIDVKQVGAALGVSHLLEGSVQQVANRVRVNVRLTNVSTGFNAWSERYDRELVDVFAVEDEIANAVARALNVQLVAGGVTRAGGTTNAEAHDQYLLGLAAFNGRDLGNAAQRFSRAIALDANYADAHSGLAGVLVLYPEYGLTANPDSAITAARAAAQSALALDSAQAAAHIALGYAAKVHGRDFAGAEREYEQALALNPNSAEGHHWYGELLMERRKFSEARAEFERSVRLDPSAPASTAMLAMSLFRIAATGGPATVDSAQSVCRHVTELSPPGGIFPFEFACGLHLARIKRFDAAQPHLFRAGTAVGDANLFVTLMADVADPVRRAAGVVRLDAARVGGQPIDQMLAAAWYLLLGNPERTIDALERVATDGSPFASFVEVLDFSALPPSPAATAVLARLGYR